MRAPKGAAWPRRDSIALVKHLDYDVEGVRCEIDGVEVEGEKTSDHSDRSTYLLYSVVRGHDGEQTLYLET